MSRVPTLFDPLHRPYSNVTVRRAFIVWLHCGQKNKFKGVCNYYHFLESLEDQMTAEKRAVSRHHETDLFTNPPPTSTYLTAIHPGLYSPLKLWKYYVQKLESIRNEKCVFKLEGFLDFSLRQGVTRDEREAMSRFIRKYCHSRSITLNKFLVEYNDYTAKTELTKSDVNVIFYVKRKMVKEEIMMIANCPKTFSFLEEDDVVDESTNFINSQRRLLDNISLLATVKVQDPDVWASQQLKQKLLSSKNVFAKKDSQNQISYKLPAPKPEQTTLDLINLLRGQFNKEMTAM